MIKLHNSKNEVWWQVRDKVRDYSLEWVKNQVWIEVRDQTYWFVNIQIWIQIWNQVGYRVRKQARQE